MKYSFTATISVDANLTGYKARCEIYDIDDNSLELATLNAGGANTQITITAGTVSTITVYIPKDETDDFDEISSFELEIEDTVGKVITICQFEFNMIERQINWETPS
jgi:hypothetical protein